MREQECNVYIALNRPLYRHAHRPSNRHTRLEGGGFLRRSTWPALDLGGKEHRSCKH